ncbi:hypothetical protein E2C01_012969 [Portunus trituberculatus]|uniref:Uncharacterized protein n=1 Tax=Portunus trituberculatus TaxID=210409 RepID=A0A5B7DFU8_PORTR|nr:hypothetical protein [Portunus trituberculatus]
MEASNRIIDAEDATKHFVTGHTLACDTGPALLQRLKVEGSYTKTQTSSHSLNNDGTHILLRVLDEKHDWGINIIHLAVQGVETEAMLRDPMGLTKDASTHTQSCLTFLTLSVIISEVPTTSGKKASKSRLLTTWCLVQPYILSVSYHRG